jgi:hypothetical protein
MTPTWPAACSCSGSGTPRSTSWARTRIPSCARRSPSTAGSSGSRATRRPRRRSRHLIPHRRRRTCSRHDSPTAACCSSATPAPTTAPWPRPLRDGSRDRDEVRRRLLRVVHHPAPRTSQGARRADRAAAPLTPPARCARRPAADNRRASRPRRRPPRRRPRARRAHPDLPPSRPRPPHRLAPTQRLTDPPSSPSKCGGLGHNQTWQVDEPCSAMWLKFHGVGLDAAPMATGSLCRWLSEAPRLLSD